MHYSKHGAGTTSTVRVQHGHKEVVVVEEARLVHCILNTTEAESGDSWCGAVLVSVSRVGQSRPWT